MKRTVLHRIISIGISRVWKFRNRVFFFFLIADCIPVLFIFCVSVCGCMYVCAQCVCVSGTCRGQKRVLEPLELELHTDVCKVPHGCWRLNLGSFERAASAVNHSARALQSLSTSLSTILL